MDQERLQEALIEYSAKCSYGETQIYRYLTRAEYADAFTKGSVQLSTLETCRQYEDEQRGDAGEATQEYKSGFVAGDGNDAALQTVSQRAGIGISGDCLDITMNNNTRVVKLPDAFVLCTTELFDSAKLSRSFGPYCVEISEPFEFFRLVTLRLNKIHCIQNAHFDRVTYRDRSYVGLEDPPGPLGFVKPPDKYQEQQEVRLFWIVKTPKIGPFLLECPQVSALCKRIA